MGHPSISAIEIEYRLNRSSRYRRTGVPVAFVATMVPAPGARGPLRLTHEIETDDDDGVDGLTVSDRAQLV